LTSQVDLSWANRREEKEPGSMSALTPLADLLGMPVPAWIVVLGLAGLYAIQHVTVARRVERHVRMLSHLDRWANSVESRLDELGQGLPLPRAVGEGYQAARRQRRGDVRSLSNEQFRALIARLVGARAA
jgi:hypothetical protein